MIAVAILALLFAGGMAWTQQQRSHQFRMQASVHEDVEQIARDAERRFLRLAADSEKAGLNGNRKRQYVAKWRAQADYHATMKRKYEQAAARGAFFVEPDPPKATMP